MNNTINLQKWIDIFRDLCLNRHQMIRGFGFGPTSDIGQSNSLEFPYVWIRFDESKTVISESNQFNNIWSFTIYCIDKPEKGGEIEFSLSKTGYILDTIIADIKDSKFYRDFDISINDDIYKRPVIEDTTDNGIGMSMVLELESPFRYTPCASPIDQPSGYQTSFNGVTTEYIVKGVKGDTGATGAGGALGYYGSFYDTTTQTNPTASAINIIKINSTAEANGINNDGGSKIIFDYPGTYNIQFSAQFDKTDGGDDDFDLWLRKNGQDVPWSNTQVSIHNNNGKSVPSWNFMLTLAGGDYIELAWSSADTAMRILAVGTQSNPTRPAIPSVILTAQQVMYTQLGATGNAGPVGNTGSIGPRGEKGEKGDIGATGPSGIVDYGLVIAYSIAL